LLIKIAAHMKKNCFLTLALPVLILTACTQDPAEPTALEQAPDTAAVQNAAPEATGPATVEELMTESIMPNVDRIWRAVSYIANAEGVTETAPETDDDWAQLRTSALELIAAGDELMNTNREILSGDFDQATTSFQYSPEEIKQLLTDNPEPWQNYIQEMQDSTRMTLQAIELKDVIGLQDFGARINQACEGCHADYWYRAPAQQ
jgi:hypothetical protein